LIQVVLELANSIGICKSSDMVDVSSDYLITLGIIMAASSRLFIIAEGNFLF